MAETTEEEVVKTADRLAALDTPPEKEAPQEQPKEQPEVKSETETAEKPVETPEEEIDLPADSKAAKAFQEMRKRNKELETELAKAKEATIAAPQGENQFSFQVPPVAPQIPVPGYNQETGDFDPIAFQQATIAEARRQASQQVEEARQVAEAEAAYPQIKPGAKEFDPVLYRAVKNTLTVEKFIEGKNVTVKGVVDDILALTKKQQQQLATEAETKVMDNIAAKESASLEASGNSARATTNMTTDEYQALRDASRQAGPDGVRARAERLSKIT